MVCKVLVVTTFGSWDTGLFLPSKKEALGCGITKLVMLEIMVYTEQPASLSLLIGYW